MTIARILQDPNIKQETGRKLGVYRLFCHSFSHELPYTTECVVNNPVYTAVIDSHDSLGI